MINYKFLNRFCMKIDELNHKSTDAAQIQCFRYIPDFWI